MVKRAWAIALVGAAVTLGVSGCGGAPPPPASADEAAPPQARTDQLDAEEPGELADPESEGETIASNTGDSGDEAQGAPPALEVRYFVSEEGLRVTVSNVEFIPKATPVRVGSGWGVKIDVKARARDDQPHLLFKPEQGPLAFYAVVERGGQKEEQGDKRRGQGEQFVTEDGIEFSRTWPGEMGMKPLAAGEQLELQVGLWGVGESMTRHRPLKGFFTVKMVGGSKPQPVISPPGTAR